MRRTGYSKPDLMWGKYKNAPRSVHGLRLHLQRRLLERGQGCRFDPARLQHECNRSASRGGRQNVAIGRALPACGSKTLPSYPYARTQQRRPNDDPAQSRRDRAVCDQAPEFSFFRRPAGRWGVRADQHRSRRRRASWSPFRDPQKQLPQTEYEPCLHDGLDNRLHSWTERVTLNEFKFGR